MNRPSACLGAAVLLLAATSSLGARAAPVPASAIPLAGVSMPRVHETVRIAGVKRIGDDFATALDAPVCFGDATENPIDGLSLSGWSDATGRYDFAVDRLEEGPEPFLDRMIVDSAAGFPEARVLRRARVALLRISDGPIRVYAFRTSKNVVLIVRRGFPTSLDAFDSGPAAEFPNRLVCGFDEIVLALTGAVARISVMPPQRLPDNERWILEADEAARVTEARFPAGRGPLDSWRVNASLSRVSRDPEPLLSVLLTDSPPEALQPAGGAPAAD